MPACKFNGSLCYHSFLLQVYCGLYFLNVEEVIKPWNVQIKTIAYIACLWAMKDTKL